MENIFRMSLFMPPISPIRDKISGKNLRNATLTPLRTVDVNEVHKLITSNAKLAAARSMGLTPESLAKYNVEKPFIEKLKELLPMIK